MKTAVVIGLLTLGAILFFAFRKDADNLSPVSVSTPLPSVETVEVGGEKFAYGWFVVEEIDDLALYPNFTQKLSTAEIIQSKKCTALVNGGFYSKADSPIGLFVTGGEKLAERSNNSLFDGFLYEVGEEVKIGNLEPSDPIFAVQSGPLLIRNGKILKQQLKNDEPARRIVAALTETGKLIFLVLYQENAKFAGPNLVDLPEAVKAVVDKIGIKLTDAINLDGGTASAFYSKDLSLTELASVGSYFCLR